MTGVMRPDLDAISSTSVLPADGGWGTEFQEIGLVPGDSPEHWNLTQPDRVFQVAQSYVDAGARVVITNTFGGNSFILGRHGLAGQLHEINRCGAQISREAAGNRALVFGSMGPTGKLLQTGEVTEDEIFETYRLQAEALWKGGADAILIETMIDVDEMKAAARAVRAATPLRMVLSMTFDSGKEKTQTMMGVTPEQAFAAMDAAGAWMVGANCGLGPENYVKVAKKLRAVTSKPIWVKANAGIPEMVGTEVKYPQTPDIYCRHVVELRAAGANIIGGCCGTTPEHVHKIAATLG